jgi:ankyrin repeat protein
MIAYGCASLKDRARAIAKGLPLLLFVFVFVVIPRIDASAGTPNGDILAAARAGDRAGVDTALASGASVNAVDENGLSPRGLAGLTPLGLAAAYGHRNIAEFLLNRGANVDGASADGFEQTPLNKAAQYGSADVAALLLDHGADINARDIAGATPLQQRRVTKMLLLY